MATSQNTWGSPSVKGVKEFAGSGQETGGAANPTPNIATGDITTRGYGMETAGWCSPNEESYSESKL